MQKKKNSPPFPQIKKIIQYHTFSLALNPTFNYWCSRIIDQQQNFYLYSKTQLSLHRASWFIKLIYWNSQLFWSKINCPLDFETRFDRTNFRSSKIFNNNFSYFQYKYKGSWLKRESFFFFLPKSNALLTTFNIFNNFDIFRKKKKKKKRSNCKISRQIVKSFICFY